MLEMAYVFIWVVVSWAMGFPGSSDGKELPAIQETQV